MIVSSDEVLGYVDDIQQSYDIINIHNSVEQFVKNYCKKNFEETQYILEQYDGDGSEYLFLNNFPIKYIDRICIGETNIIRIQNINHDTNATVSVTDSGVRLVYNNTPINILFSANNTVSNIISSINLVSGWSAELIDVNYSNFKSTELIKKYGMNVLSSYYVDLSVPDNSYISFDVKEDIGCVRINGCFPRGLNNIRVTYTAGYSTDDIPYDLKEAIKQFVKFLYVKKEENSFGLEQYRIGTNSILSIFEKGLIPKEIKSVFDYYRKIKV